MRQLAKYIVAGSALAGAPAMFVGVPTAGAVDQPVTFEVLPGALSIAQTPTAGTALIQSVAVAMPTTRVTDARNAFDRTARWTVSGSVTDLTEPLGAVIDSDQITLNSNVGSFTHGTGTIARTAAVASGVLIEATLDSIDSVYSYAPTALVAAQTSPNSGVYTGVVTQTVV